MQCSTARALLRRDLSSALRRCGDAKDLIAGKTIHSRIIANPDLSSDTLLANLLVQMYGKCGCLDEARRAFDSTDRKNTYSWGILLAAYARSGSWVDILRLHRQMLLGGILPDAIVLSIVLNASSSLGDLRHGKLAHQQAIESGIPIDLIMETLLISLYAQSRDVEQALQVFRSMKLRDLVAWTSIITAVAHSGHLQQAMTLYQELLLEGLRPDALLFTSVVIACTSLVEARAVHSQITSLGICCDDILSKCLVQMYARLKSLSEARSVFNRLRDAGHCDVGTWTTMIAAYNQAAQPVEALELFKTMVSAAGMSPSATTLAAALDACSSLKDLECGKWLHSLVVPELSSDLLVQTALVDMYSKCSSLDDAKLVFQQMQQRDSVAWNAMIEAYAQAGDPDSAVNLLSTMDLEGTEANQASFVSVLSACASGGSIAMARMVHSSITSSRFFDDITVQNAVLNVYAKSGGLEDAGTAFRKLTRRTVVSWNTMLISYAQHGHTETAVELRRSMDLEGIVPDRGTLACLATACSHCGSLDGGLHCFLSIVGDRGIEANPDHYVITAELLARAGNLDEAEELLDYMPFEPDPTCLRNLLSACKVHGDVDRGARVAIRLSKADPSDTGSYLMLSSMYSAAGQWQ